MKRQVAGLVFILFAAAVWAYLDYLNEKEIAAAEAMHQAVLQAHARAVAEEKVKALSKARFEAELFAEMSKCRMDAEKSNNEYFASQQKKAGGKQALAAAAQSGKEGEAGMLESAYEVCQKIYDIRAKNGI